MAASNGEFPPPPGREGKLAKKLDAITKANWQMIPLHIEFQGAHVIDGE